MAGNDLGAFYVPGHYVTVAAPAPIMNFLNLIDFFTVIFLFFVPLISIVVGCNKFGEDKAESITDSILVRQVTRTQILLVRYCFSAAYIAIAFEAMVGLIYAKPFLVKSVNFFVC
jgi:ABC-type transport system involved in multi-copper enzyme maturation permease subunit